MDFWNTPLRPIISSTVRRRGPALKLIARLVFFGIAQVGLGVALTNLPDKSLAAGAAPSGTATATPALTATPGPGATRTDAKGVTVVYVPAGCFMMGSDPKTDPNAIANEQPQHKVCITHSFWLDKTLVTNAEFAAFVKDGGYANQKWWSTDGWQWLKSRQIGGPALNCTQSSSAPDQPRVCVSYYEAEAYAKWRGGRLLTEAEWEYAARGPNEYIYAWGNTFDRTKANTHATGVNATSKVCSYPDGNNWLGACDITGNAWEWTADWHGETYYQTSPTNDPPGPTGGIKRILRGGSWRSLPERNRTSFRGHWYPSGRLDYVGMRIAVVSP